MNKEWKEEQIRDYLLGRLGEKETAEIDELSVIDDEFALRLQVVENELLDGYLKGEIPEHNLIELKGRYLTYPPRRKKIKIAKIFHHLLVKEAQRKSEEKILDVQRFPWLVAAAIVLIFVTAFLAFQNIQMRNNIAHKQAELKTLRVRELELRKQLDQTTTNQDQEKSEMLMAMNLPPATRGISKTPILEVPTGTDAAILTLPLETSHFHIYQVVLRDPATNRILWISERRKAGKNIQIKVPVNVFETQHYQFELYGISTSGGMEFAAGYPISVIRK